MSVTIRTGAWWGEIGQIDRAFLGIDHGIFAVDLGFSFGASHQGIGYIQLDGEGFDGLGLLRRLTQIVGPLPSCVGRHAIVLREQQGHGQIVGIQQLTGEKRMVWEAFRIPEVPQ